jgi:hypothetical protein
MRLPGGRCRPLPNTILALDTFFGYKEIMVIHHTGISVKSTMVLAIIYVDFDYNRLLWHYYEG